MSSSEVLKKAQPPNEVITWSHGQHLAGSFLQTRLVLRRVAQVGRILRTGHQQPGGKADVAEHVVLCDGGRSLGLLD